MLKLRVDEIYQLVKDGYLTLIFRNGCPPGLYVGKVIEISPMVRAQVMALYRAEHGDVAVDLELY